MTATEAAAAGGRAAPGPAAVALSRAPAPGARAALGQTQLEAQRRAASYSCSARRGAARRGVAGWGCGRWTEQGTDSVGNLERGASWSRGAGESSLGLPLQRFSFLLGAAEGEELCVEAWVVCHSERSWGSR